MNKQAFYTLSIPELKENVNRLTIGTSQLSELLSSLEEERQELESTKDMLIKTLAEIAPKEKLVERILVKAKDMWTDLWKKQTQSEDKDEWTKIMKEFE
jgi:regulator of replication initiation timing